MLRHSLLNFCIRNFSSAEKNGIKNILIIGGGQMGSGVAQVSAIAGYNVSVIDMNKEILTKSESSISRGLKLTARKMKSQGASEAQLENLNTAMERLNFDTDFSYSAVSADLVVEAVVEKLEIKKEIFKSVESLCKDSTILATNTSSLPVGQIMAGVKNKSRCAGLHFFNPVALMRLVEVIKIPETDQGTINSLKNFADSVGKTSVQCKDTAGFIVNRLLLPYLAEAMKMYDRGDAEMRDIDTAMKQGANYPLGPFELIDYIGLDTIKFILDFWSQVEPENPQFMPIGVLDKLVAEGKLGVKTKQGFYKY